MARGARKIRQRPASFVVKIDADVIAEAERLAGAGRMSRDTYLTYALRHYNRFHALTKHQRPRTGRSKRVVLMFPPQAKEPGSSTRGSRKSRRRS